MAIYDTCDDVRRKINARLRELSRIASSDAENPDRKISGTQLSTFMNKKGPMSGAESGAYYVAYVFFEKLRTLQKKPMSRKRER